MNKRTDTHEDGFHHHNPLSWVFSVRKMRQKKGKWLAGGFAVCEWQSHDLVLSGVAPEATFTTREPLCLYK